MKKKRKKRYKTYRKRLWICRVFDILRTGHVEIDTTLAVHATIDGGVIVQLYRVRHLVALQQRKLNGLINVVGSARFRNGPVHIVDLMDLMPGVIHFLVH